MPSPGDVPLASTGRLVAIYFTATAGGDLAAVPSVEAVKDVGLRGDRYADGVGSFSRWPGSGRAVTMIEAEVVDAVRREFGIDLSAGQHRRNLVTSGVRLEELNGRQFRIGTTLLRGVRLCAPCRYLERLVGPGTFDALSRRGGLRTDILESGQIGVGDEIIPVGTASYLP